MNTHKDINMKTIKYLHGTKILSAISLVFSSFGFTSESIALCNTCSDQQMQSKAIQYAPNGGKVHVIDYTGNRIKAFQTEREEGLLMYWPIPVKQAIKTSVNQAKQVSNTIKDLANGQVTIDHLRPFLGSYTNIASAHSVAKSVYEKQAIQQALSDYFTGNVAGALTSATVTLGNSIINQVLAVQMAVDVAFPSDGTTYTFKFKGVIKNLNGKVSIAFEPVAFSGRDKGIMLSEGNYSGYQARGSSEALQRIINHMVQSGVKVYIEGRIYNGGTVIINDIICSDEPPKGCKASK
ncbi:hypothetical protein PAUR_a1545 [Pseudoalteromonas aurantia 208]|uniref:Curli production assembly/transport component CsgG n=2 Tax=Pseudoalteromonas aurantia TaxID=43654 RepID=A0ABR9EAQ3_9GAMM|nr:hypothetical protein [Pseudoalteromonas aurantia 208]